jgi:hypothetical protein
MTTAEVSLPKVPKSRKPVSAPSSIDQATAAKPEVQSRDSLTYGEAVKLIAGALSNNENSILLCEVIRDIVSGTGLDVSYEPQEEEGGKEEEEEAS